MKKAFVRKLRHKNIIIYCTGGIRAAAAISESIFKSERNGPKVFKRAMHNESGYFINRNNAQSAYACNRRKSPGKNPKPSF